ncbi:conserved hypothetical protein [Solidesulfovibrio fructosivorans JJ]]|uniref:Uncharacterized protein n=1 Tax=Solidesulfovibrio fructosivorans JJ] TaxID=596151 RepID=E1JS04_SOLFR|nr:hypothetical protein [Solidesulfovibrio fructosivorans]EFL52773.1 conserved hypothetical protein [Solidesulfovibrio fructosivorans JJ]]
MEEGGQEIRVYAGLGETGLPQAVAGADRLFFHAGMYSNFGRDPEMAAALETALTRPGFERLDIVSFDPVAGAAYWEEFRAILRRDVPEVTLRREFAASAAFCDALATRHPTKVRLFRTKAMPLAPILLVGDTIFAGHYLHGSVPAPQGLWLAIPADVADLLSRAEDDASPEVLDPVAKGAYRLVCECVAARNASRRLA